VATCFGLAPAVAGAVICAWADTQVATIINVAVSIDLMTSLGSVAEWPIKHICLVGNRYAMIQGSMIPLFLRKDALLMMGVWSKYEMKPRDITAPC
jgi:hypothetical protein